jgi:hypothetical protein
MPAFKIGAMHIFATTVSILAILVTGEIVVALKVVLATNACAPADDYAGNNE